MRVAFSSVTTSITTQKPVSDALMSGTAQYTFISTQKLDVERKALDGPRYRCPVCLHRRRDGGVCCSASK